MSKRLILGIVMVSLFFFSCKSQYLPDAGQFFPRALFCFQDKYIYHGCNEAYRLDQSGDINIPAVETDSFCYGSCLEETQRVLDCIEETVPDFVFINRATIQVMRETLREGCSHSLERGEFNVGNHLGNDWSIANQPLQTNLFSFVMVASSAVILLTAVCPL